MPTVGLVILVLGVAVIRQVLVGRAKQTPSDFKDATIALLNGDSAGVATVMQRRGSNTDTGAESESALGSVDGTSSSGSAPVVPSSGRTALAAECVRLGSNAKGYRLGATGPDYYDCSGLVWRACLNLGIYKGPRFTTRTFTFVAPKFATRINAPEPGCIVIWVAAGHMGIMLNENAFYSARSPEKGIGSANLIDDITYFGSTPMYWRVK